MYTLIIRIAIRVFSVLIAIGVILETTHFFNVGKYPSDCFAGIPDMIPLYLAKNYTDPTADGSQLLNTRGKYQSADYPSKSRFETVYVNVN